MTANRILDAFSETLIQDDRILSLRERELLTSLLQNARAASKGNAEVQSAVTAVIARTLGETVSQRAFSLLGSSIVERIVAPGATSDQADLSPPGSPNSPDPGPPSPGPQPPGHSARSTPQVQWERTQDSSNGVAILEPSNAPTQCIVLDEFITPQELDELIQYTLQHEADFRGSEVISRKEERGVTDYDHRRSRVLMNLGTHEEVILDRIRGVLPGVLDQLGMEEFPVTRAEVQITASNDGDFFHAHCDNTQERVSSRCLTFVYFFHREPRRFVGGELRLYDPRRKGEWSSSTSGYQTIVPQQNQIVFFPCSVLHEITAVKCSSRVFADSRFTLNGWLHK
jgi:Rps23 Pro-64 3,4-dihydroxylase Tpa1-like proline 4-hydroxylase